MNNRSTGQRLGDQANVEIIGRRLVDEIWRVEAAAGDAPNITVPELIGIDTDGCLE